MLVQMAACRSGNPRGLTGSWLEWQTRDQTSHFCPLTMAEHLGLVSPGFILQCPLLHRSWTTATLLNAKQIEKENLPITEVSLSPDPGREKTVITGTWWVIVHWVSIYCVCLALRKEKGLAFLAHAFSYYKGAHGTDSLFAVGETETEGEGREITGVLSTLFHLCRWVQVPRTGGFK